MSNDKFEFLESSPKAVVNKMSREKGSNSYAKLLNNIKLQSNSTNILKLTVPEQFQNLSSINFIPLETKKSMIFLNLSILL